MVNHREGRTTGRRTRSRSEAPPGDANASLRFSRINAVLGASGLLVMGLGYALLAQGSVTLAPLLLVVAYVVLLPLAIIR